ncbi:MAG: RDD family protein [Candidatus Bathyarchaeota archaeon]|nr:RDD family protein [Candidatus Bathyarchaeota archaeon]
MTHCIKCGSALPEGAKYCPACGAVVTAAASAVPPAKSQVIASGLKLAFWGERFVAWLIDVIIIGVAIGILNLFNLLAGFSLAGWPNWIPFFNAGGVLYFLYWVLMEGIYGQSLGKMIMQIKVVRLDGGAIGFSNAALESVGKAFLLPLDCILGWVLYPKSRQRAFNYLSQTIVVKVT